MISWIQKYFQHHFRTIFAILLAGTIVSFVISFSPSGGVGRTERQIADAPFFGLNLASQGDQQKLFGDAQLSILLQAGFPALEGAQMQQYAFTRLAAITLANSLNMPAPTDAELTQHVKMLRIFAGENGEFDLKRYNDFRANPRRFLNISEADVSRVIADDIRVAAVQKLLGGPGYVLTPDVQSQLQRFESVWSIAVATVDYKSFAPAITPDNAVLTKFFENNTDRYVIPPQVSVRAALFSSAPYLDSATVTEAEVKAFYDANPARFPKPADKADAKKTTPTKPADPAADFAAVRSQVEMALKIEHAASAATKAATDFSLALYNQKITPGTPAFDTFLSSRNITLRDIPPFSRDNPPAELGNSPEAANEAFKLSKDRLYSDAVPSLVGSAVLFFKEIIPARQPLLAEVKTKVTADYIENERQLRFVTLGKTLCSQLETRLKAGDNFEKAVATVAASSPAKIEQKAHTPFSLSQRPQDLDYLVLGTLETLKKGGLSEMITDNEKGVIVYALDRKTPDLTETNQQYLSTRNRIAQVVASRTSGEYLRAKVEAELAKSKIQP